MSNIQIPSVPNPTLTQGLVLGDLIDLTPSDGRFSYSYAAPTKPGGSTATFSGATFTPDVVGAYRLTVTAGADVLSVNVFVFSAANLSALATDIRGATRPDALKRQILSGLCATQTTAVLTTWAGGGAFPPGVNMRQIGDG